MAREPQVSKCFNVFYYQFAAIGAKPYFLGRSVNEINSRLNCSIFGNIAKDDLVMRWDKFVV